MAITAASFVPDQPEQRRLGMANTAENAPGPGEGGGMTSAETPHATHSITGGEIALVTGAGKGSIRKGLMH